MKAILNAELPLFNVHFFRITAFLSCSFLMFFVEVLVAQSLNGKVLNSADNKPVAFANIGIPGKSIGTVSDESGKFNLSIEKSFETDSLFVSCIGFEPYKTKLSEYSTNKQQIILLKEKAFELAEVIIKPQKVRIVKMGVTGSKKIASGFSENKLGYECGILLTSKKPAMLKSINLNIAHCEFDTVFYRINMYKVKGKLEFENIMESPFYFTIPKNQVKNMVSIDIKDRNIKVKGDFLVTIEHVKDLGKGYLYFGSGFTHKTYFRKTSFGNWETAPIGIGLTVIAEVED